MKKFRALYIVGVMLVVFLVVLIYLQLLMPSPITTSEIDHYSIEVGNEYKVGFKIYNIGNRDEDYTFVLQLNGKKVGKNTIPIIANGTFEYTTYLPANKVGNGNLNVLIYKSGGKELIDNVTHYLIPEQND